jgi:hypothetical protein
LSAHRPDKPGNCRETEELFHWGLTSNGITGV